MSEITAERTKRLLIDAGIGPGMRVLDAGCGRGEVSFMAAGLVGPKGAVVGVDRDAGAIAQARRHAEELGLTNVTFAEQDIRALSPEHKAYDAVLGRRVLMYQDDPVEAVRGLGRALKPGGLAVFQEHDAQIARCLVELPLHSRVRFWLWRTVEKEGANLQMGFELRTTLAHAGLAVERVRAEAVVQTPEQAGATADIVRAMLPRIVKQGVATEKEIDVDTLAARLTAELAEAEATYIGEMVFGAWARKPA